MLTFLHLSDIHFRHNQSGNTLDPDEELRNELLRDILDFGAEMKPVTGILITGDIAYGGKREEFDFARTWLDEVCGKLGCEPTRIWCVPGNHDVDRDRRSVTVETFQQSLSALSADKYDIQLERTLDVEDGEVLFGPLHEYNEFAKPLGCASTRLGPYWEEVLPLGDGVELGIRGLNSALLCTPADGDEARNQLAVGRCQSTHHRKRGQVRLTLCHHPPAWLKDQIGFEERLCAPNAVPIQLYGHEHRFQVECHPHYLRLHAGAFHPSRTDPGWTPRYNWLRIGVDEDSCPKRLIAEVHPRTWTVSRRFEPDSKSCGGENHFVWFTGLDSVDFPCPGIRGRVDCVTELPDDNQSEEATLEKLDRERKLIYDYMRLSFVDSVRIASEMNLIEPGDETASDLDKRKLAFKRAVERNQLDELATQLNLAIHGEAGGQ